MEERRLENLPDVLDLKELAIFLGCGYRTALKLVHTRGFPCLRLGKKWRVSKAGLVRWLEQQTMQE